MSDISIVLAEEEDAPSLAEIMTAAFSASDAAYPLIWTAQAPPGLHDDVALNAIFTPVQHRLRVTYKAMAGDRLVGFATWSLPDVNAPKKHARVEVQGDVNNIPTMPKIPGVEWDLWYLKQKDSQEAGKRDVEPSEDIGMFATPVIFASAIVQLYMIIGD